MVFVHRAIYYGYITPRRLQMQKEIESSEVLGMFCNPITTEGVEDGL